ncbi:MAG: hypothetical protein HFG40_04300, partial [Bacilli bacterium]|nr:hypothetical protein [Bacilli bacterium]
EYFKEKYPEDEIYFILGSDLYSSFSTWKNYSYILEHYKILIVLRDDDQLSDLEGLYREFKKQVVFTDVHPFVLSSTRVREALRENDFLFVRNYVSPKVVDFIIEQGLYRKENKEGE